MISRKDLFGLIAGLAIVTAVCIGFGLIVAYGG